MLKTCVLLKSLILYFSILLLHLELSISMFNFIASLGYNTSFSNLQTYEHVPAPINPIDFILLGPIYKVWFKMGAENSGVTIVTLLEWIIFFISMTCVSPMVSTSTIPSVEYFSIVAIKLYLILKVFNICYFFESGVLKQRWLYGNQSGRWTVNG